jgi:hypothetical protein
MSLRPLGEGAVAVPSLGDILRQALGDDSHWSVLGGELDGSVDDDKATRRRARRRARRLFNENLRGVGFGGELYGSVDRFKLVFPF